MQQTNAVRKPEGGFVFITVRQLCRVWLAYHQHRIRLVDVWVWWAAHEVVAKRCQANADQQRCYRVEELDRLVGSAHSRPQSLRRLAQAGLVCWDEEQITFPEEATSMDEFQALTAMLEQIPNHERRVPVPRRIIRYVAGGCRRVGMATILGHLLRCLYYRAGHCCPDGHCKAPWIAQVFGVGLRQVKRARQHLERLGLFQRHDAPQWVLNRYGVDCTINLQWDGPSHDEGQHESPAVLPSATPARSSLGLHRDGSVVVPVALTMTDMQTLTYTVGEDSSTHLETVTESVPPSCVAPLDRVPADVDREHATGVAQETTPHAASGAMSGSFVAMVLQARADLKAGRSPLADVAPIEQRRQCAAHQVEDAAPAAPHLAVTPAAPVEAACAATPESTPTQRYPGRADSSETDQHRSHHVHGEPHTETRTASRLPAFHPIQAVLSTLQLATVAAPIVNHPRSTDGARADAGAAPSHPLEATPRNVTPAPFDTPHEMTPLGSTKQADIAPPDSDRKLSQREEEDQKPAARGGAGILSALVHEVRAEMKAGVPARSVQTPVLNPSVSATLQEKRASRGEHKTPVALAPPSAGAPVASVVKATAQPLRQTPSAVLPPPTLRHILVQDLRDTTRLLQLYAHAVTAGLTGRSEADRLNFVALAHHVLSYRPENPGGLFSQLLRKRHFDYITQDDEDAAQRRLKCVLYGGTVPVLHDEAATEQRRAG